MANSSDGDEKLVGGTSTLAMGLRESRDSPADRDCVVTYST